VTRIVVLVPGLLGPWAQEFREYVSEELAAPALQWWLARGSRIRCESAVPTFECTIARLFGVPETDDATFAHAAFAALADGLAVASGEALVRLDPVFLNATPHGAEVVAGEALGLSLDDAHELVSFLNAELDAPWVIELAHATRWYVRLPVLPALDTMAPAAMVGARTASLLPQGTDGQPWRRWLTELQMLLHAHPLNVLREQASQRPINSAWLWGQGCLPEAPAKVVVTRTFADSEVARGVAQWHGSEVLSSAAAAGADFDAAKGDMVVLVHDCCTGLAESGDVEGWRRALLSLERKCFAPLMDAFRSGRLGHVELHAPGAAAIELTSWSRYRIWRLQRPLSAWLSDV
jgi:hypothetical protein